MDTSASQNNSRKELYKKMIDNLAQINERVGIDAPSESCGAVDRVLQVCEEIQKDNDVAQKMEHSSEVVMDAQVLKVAHEVMSKVLHTSSEFSAGIYQNAISSKVFRGDSQNWEEIMKISIGVCRCLATSSSMLGAIDVEPKERIVKERKKGNRITQTQEQKPESVRKLKRQGAGAEKVNTVLKQVNDIFTANDCKPIPFYKLIVDPQSFMNSVENAFQMAFLTRDGNIAIEMGPDGHPQVRLASKTEMEARADTTQAICSLSMELCESMAKLYNIQEPLLNIPEYESAPSSDDEEPDNN